MAAYTISDRKLSTVAESPLGMWLAVGFAVLAAALLSLPSALGEAPQLQDASPDELRPKETVFSLAVKGGWLMIPIGLSSVIVLTWTIERLVSLRKSRMFSPGLLERIFETLPPRGRAAWEHVAAAERICDGAGTLVARVLKTGVEKIHRDEQHALAFLEEAVSKEVHVLRRSLRVFEICASVAPLLGLLGTVFGMIACFERASAADTAARAETLASGIYVALVTTAAGLCVAIPALLVHHYFLSRVDRAQDAMEEAATEFLDHYYGSASAVRVRLEAGRAAGAAPRDSSRANAGSLEAGGTKAESVQSGMEVGS